MIHFPYRKTENLSNSRFIFTTVNFSIVTFVLCKDECLTFKLENPVCWDKVGFST